MSCHVQETTLIDNGCSLNTHKSPPPPTQMYCSQGSYLQISRDPDVLFPGFVLTSPSWPRCTVPRVHTYKSPATQMYCSQGSYLQVPRDPDVLFPGFILTSLPRPRCTVPRVRTTLLRCTPHTTGVRQSTCPHCPQSQLGWSTLTQAWETATTLKHTILLYESPPTS